LPAVHFSNILAKEWLKLDSGGDARLYTAPRDAELNAFANDLKTRCNNNEGQLMVTIAQVG
jgi:hypothetical protein